MHALASARLSRILTFIIPTLFLAGCFGEGEGQQRILNAPVPPPPPVPEGFCDPINFEPQCPQPTSFTDFEGGVITVESIADLPDAVADGNDSTRVGRMLKFAAESGATFGGSIIGLASPLDVTAGSSFTMKVWSPRSVRVLLQPEPQGPGTGAEVTHGGTGWEEMTFPLPGLSGTVNGITLIFDLGVLGNSGGDPANWTFYFDDITLVPGDGGGGGGGGGATTLPVDFEGATDSYDFGPDGGFEGGAASVIANPQSNGTNTSAQVGQMLKFPGAVFGGATLAIDPTEVAAGSSFTMKVWSQRSVPVLLQPEPQGPGSGVEVVHGGTGWEDMTFPLPALSGTLSGITLIFDNGTVGAADTDPVNWTFYFDDITLVPGGGGGGGATTLPVDFEGATDSYDFGPDGGFEGGAASVIANPQSNGTNTSAQVGQMLKFPGAVFGGATLAIDPTEVAAGSSFTMKVWSQRSVPVLLQPEPQGPGSGVEVVHGGTGWEEMTFPLPNLSGTLSGITLIFDNGTVGAADTDPINWTFYFDDITLVPGGGGGGGSFTPITFDDPGTTYTLIGFGGAEDSSVVVDPAGGTNMVVQVNRSNSAETFAGTVVSTGPNESIPDIPLDAQNTQMSVRVYSPAAGIQVRLKVEDASDNTKSVETEATTTVAGAWETLVFDFANEATGTAAFNPATTYNKVAIFFNFGVAGATAGAQTFYFDDIDVVAGSGGGGGSALIDFESGSATFNDFEGGVATVIPNPDISGINTSTQVGQMQKFAGATFAGSTLDLGGAVALAAGDSYTMKVRASREVVVTMKLEPLNEERTATHSGSGTWEELCFDFTGVSGNVTGITLIFDNGTVGDAANDPANWTFQFDDIGQTDSCGGGGGGGSFAPITFDDPAITYTLIGFGGAEGSTVTNDPAGGTNMVVQVDRSATAETFAGTVVSTGPNESIPVIPLDAMNTQMSVRVYSPAAGIQVRLKVEDASDNTRSVETEATTTVAGAWETLVFDFANEATGTAAFDPATTYNKVAIFFNFGVAGATAGAQTFYFDDIDVAAGSGGGGATTLPVDFEGATDSYDFGPDGGFEGGAASVIANPQSNGTNTSAQVGQMLKFPGAVFGGATLAIDPTEVVAGSSFTMKVWSQRSVPVLLQPEPQGPGSGVEVVHGGTGWEEMTFPLPALSGTLSGITLIFDNGTVGAADTDPVNWTFYFDDITLVPGGGGGGGATTLPVDFEGATDSYDFGPDGGFEGGAASVIANPQSNGTNTSAQVGQMLKFPGAVFGGATLAIDPTEVAAGSSFTMKVWSQRSVPVLLQPEPQGPGSGVEVVHGGTGWEEMTFPLPNLSGTLSGITLIFDNGTVGAADTDPVNWTFYFDDITLVPGGGGGPGGTVLVTFDEATPPEVTEFGGAGFAIEPGPAGGDGNALKIVRDGGDVFAGAFVTISGIPNDAGTQTVSALVYSPTAGIPMVVKLEFGENMGTGDVSANETVVVGWQTLTWTFTNLAPPNDYNRFVILPNLGTVDTATSYYFDNITLVDTGGGGGGGSATIDFESGSATFNDFEGGVAAVIPNPDVNGINTSTQVGQMQKFAGATFAGSTLDLGGAVALAAGDSYTMKVRASREVVVTMKLEPLNEERTATHSGSGTWEELCFDFTGVSGNVTGITLIFDNGTVGDAANDPANWTFQFDDIGQTDSCGGGGGGGSFAPITFDDPAITYTLIGFGGAEGSTVTNDPAGGTNMVVQVDRSATAETFAGTVVSTGPNESIPVIPLDAMNTQMSVRVYSPAAGIQVRLKVEDASDNTRSVETEATTTVAGAWETLVFDFANEATGTAAFDPATTYNKVAIFFNFGVAGATAGAQTFYFDDIDVAAGSGGGGGTVLVTFDEATPPEVTEFGGAGFAIEPGPAGGDGNALKIVRDGGDVFAGAFVAVTGIPNDAGTQTMSALVYSPTAGIPMVVKLEFGQNMGTGDVSANEAVVVGWQTLTWTFTNLAPPNDYNRFVILPNLGTVDTATSYYFDNITLVDTGGGGGGGSAGLPVTFDEATPPEVTEFGGAGYAIEPGPAGGDGNALKIVRDGGDVFAGAFVAVTGIPNDAGTQTMSALVYSPTAGIPMVVKLEFGQNMGTGDVSANEAVVVGWQTLTWTFTNLAPPNDYNRFVILPNLGTVDTATSYYFDNIDLVGGG